jgi:hypothetical protein
MKSMTPTTPIHLAVLAVLLALAGCGNVEYPWNPDAGPEAGDDGVEPADDRWSPVEAVGAFATHAVAADPTGALVLAGMGGTGNDCRTAPDREGCTIVRSTDGGATWGEIETGLPYLDVRGLAVSGSVAVATAIGGFGVVDDRILRSEDGGASWTVVSTSTGVGEQRQAIAIDPLAPVVVYAADFSLATRAAGDSYVVRSGDGGKTWLHLRETAGDELRGHAFAFDGEGALYVGGTGTPAVARSADGGGTFVGLGPASLVHALAVDPTDAELLYAGTRDDGVIRSLDGGQSFAPTGTGLAGVVSALAIDPDAPATIYAATDLGVFVTHNRGTTWESFGDGLPLGGRVLALVLTAQRRLVAGTDTGVFTRRLGPP